MQPGGRTCRYSGGRRWGGGQRVEGGGGGVMQEPDLWRMRGATAGVGSVSGQGAQNGTPTHFLCIIILPVESFWCEFRRCEDKTAD